MGRINIVLFLLLVFFSCKMKSDPEAKLSICHETVEFGAFMLEGADYSVELSLFVSDGELDAKIEDLIEERPEVGMPIKDYIQASVTNGSGKLFYSSYDVASYLKTQLDDFKCDLTMKMESFSICNSDSIAYIVYVKPKIE